MKKPPLRLPFASALAGALLLLAAAAAHAGDSAPESSYAARNGFAFAVLGDAPTRTEGEPGLAEVLHRIGLDADLILHTGNLKGRDERCDDSVYARRRSLLAASPVPLVYTPGANDWAECDRDQAGQFNPVDRLARLRELFFDDDLSLGQLTLAVQRQSETARFRSYAENARWEYGGILFVTLNVPANHNNFRSAAGRNGEFEERVQANQFWLRRAFAEAARLKTRGIVVAFQADPHFDGRRDAAANGSDPYAGLKTELARLAPRYPGQVLVVHGANGEGGSSRAQDAAAGKTLAALPRVSVLAAPRAPAWVRIRVAPAYRGVFKIEAAGAPHQP